MTSERYFTASNQTEIQGENLQKLMSSTLGLLSTLKNYTSGQKKHKNLNTTRNTEINKLYKATNKQTTVQSRQNDSKANIMVKKRNSDGINLNLVPQ